jgi:DNA-binding CsgD family transcriptional regulator
MAESEVGLILFDKSLNPIAFDRGAAGILNYHPQNGNTELAGYIPREMWDVVGRHHSTIRAGGRTRIHAGENDYLCRAYLVETSNGSLTNPLVVLHLEKIRSTTDTVQELGSKFHFTEREEEVLSGISKGLTSNEIAAQLKISPNTVRSFIRLIRTKMGLTRRSEIVASILKPRERFKQQSHTEENI